MITKTRAEILRSQNMAAIKNKNTKPELKIRSALFQLGYRYRLHSPHLAGKPDLVLKKYRTVIFVHGCFWHQHSCRYFQWPKQNADFWQDKISKNVVRDTQNILALQKMGWKICIWWECSGKNPDDFAWAVTRFQQWLHEDKSTYLEL